MVKDVAQALGASAILKPSVESYELMSAGVVDVFMGVEQHAHVARIEAERADIGDPGLREGRRHQLDDDPLARDELHDQQIVGGGVAAVHIARRQRP